MTHIPTLPDAIRAGAQFRPQLTYHCFGLMPNAGDLLDEDICGSCALGSAYEGVQGQQAAPFAIPDTVVADFLYATYPHLATMVTHPVTGQVNTLQTVIVSLNDHERWTRERIADWIDTLDIAPVS